MSKQVVRNARSHSGLTTSLIRKVASLESQVRDLKQTLSQQHVEQQATEESVPITSTANAPLSSRRTLLKWGTIAVAAGIGSTAWSALNAKPAHAAARVLSSDYSNYMTGTAWMAPDPYYGTFNGAGPLIFLQPTDQYPYPAGRFGASVQGNSNLVGFHTNFAGINNIGIQSNVNGQGSSAIDANVYAPGSFGVRITASRGAFPLYIVPSDNSGLPLGAPVGTLYVNSTGNLWYRGSGGWIQLA